MYLRFETITWSFSEYLSRVLILALFLQLIAANGIVPASSTFESNQNSTASDYRNNTNLLQSFDPGQSNDEILLEIITNQINKYVAIFLPNNTNPHRLKRGSISPPTSTSTNTDKLQMIETQIGKIKEDLSILKKNSSLNSEDRGRIGALETSVGSISALLDTLKLDMNQQDKKTQEKIATILQQMVVVTFYSVVQSIRSHQFSYAAELLKLSDEATIKRVVQEVYDKRVDNFDLLLSFGSYIRDHEFKFKIYQALHNEMKTSGHKDARKLFKLYQSLKKEIRESSTGTIAAETQSLIDNLWNEIQEAAIEPFCSAFLNDNSWPVITQLNNDIYHDNYSCLSSIYDKVIEKVIDKLGVENFLNKTRKNLPHSEEHILFDDAVMKNLETSGKLHSDFAKPLARYMKSTIVNSNYHTLPEQWQSRYEIMINKLPQSLKNLFYFKICKKNPKCKEYIYAAAAVLFDYNRKIYGGLFS